MQTYAHTFIRSDFKRGLSLRRPIIGGGTRFAIDMAEWHK